ncbi:leucine-rich repeat and coiled-coil domain-containing protein 1-like [Elysia marginata]|uniref:Leucine-rich repeat and coiled-coil domain-containing protein 1 n=1 Tax=Elysia marginata TaxID=1093978 RepID=A0AAV4J4K6_9GAST|nr:leucine-rich repeat and coiled-coil domain-containing protein 1-like [Elysia marginata]
MASTTLLDGSKHLSLIDAGVSNIWSLSLPGHLESLNLHGNYIRHISNLSHLTRLRHLDLSANQISAIDGLDSLVCLQTINLSCNLITSLDGLPPLRRLERLNLSYNQIDNLDGMATFSGSSFKLSHVALHGNRLRDIRHLVQCLSSVTSLKHLVLSQDGSGNPLCHSQGYIPVLRTQLPHLETINDMDKNGRLSKEVDSVATIPGLEAYLDFLLSSREEETKTEKNPPNSKTSAAVITPKIDAVMEQFKQRCLQESSSSSFDRDAAAVASNSPRSGSATGRKKNIRMIPSDREKSEMASSSNFSDRLGVHPESASSGEDSEPVKESAPVQVKPRPGLRAAVGKVKGGHIVTKKIR